MHLQNPFLQLPSGRLPCVLSEGDTQESSLRLGDPMLTGTPQVDATLTLFVFWSVIGKLLSKPNRQQAELGQQGAGKKGARQGERGAGAEGPGLPVDLQAGVFRGKSMREGLRTCDELIGI